MTHSQAIREANQRLERHLTELAAGELDEWYTPQERERVAAESAAAGRWERAAVAAAEREAERRHAEKFTGDIHRSIHENELLAPDGRKPVVNIKAG